MKRRKFVKDATTIGLGLSVLPLVSCGSDSNSKDSNQPGEQFKVELPKLDYAYDALEPAIDARTMEIHHSKHHAGYASKLGTALEGNTPFKSLETMLGSLTDQAEHLALRNNGGGHYNHSLFWRLMQPGGKAAPSGALLEAIEASFSSFEKMSESFAKAAATRFGSGWAWLCRAEDQSLFVCSTPNQDNPLMKNLVSQGGKPLLAIDVWEHAYYLIYQNRRKEYINNWMQLVNWDVVEERFSNTV